MGSKVIGDVGSRPRSHATDNPSPIPTAIRGGAALRSEQNMTQLQTDPGTGERFDVAGKAAYLIGIGGCGMSGLGGMLRARGAAVAASDRDRSDATETLAREGVKVGFDQSKSWLPEACDLVIASAAVRPDHPQWLEAERRGIPVMLYAEALGRCMLGSTGVAIAGTHGKSTTTAMLGGALVDAGLDPTVIVGGTCRQLGRGNLGASASDPSVGFRLGGPTIPMGDMKGRPGVLVAEACEFNRSFHNFRPLLASISSVEADHLDVYASFEAVIESFHQFARLLHPSSVGGKLLIAHEGAQRREVTAGLDSEVQTIGFAPEADWVVQYDVGTRRVTLSHDREVVAHWRNTVPGSHNAFNAGVALVLATWLGAEPALAAESLGHFRGVDRRTQLLGEKELGGGTVRVFDDYGHHPTEIDTTLRALREAERPEERGGRLICVFQPHQHSRTRHLMEEFASAFSQADVVIVPHIYFVRDSEEERQRVTAGDLVDRLRQRGVKAMHLYPFEAIVEQLENLCRPGDVLVVMGAGNVWQVG